MDLQDIAVNETMRRLLVAAGQQDRLKNVDLEEGWAAVARACGFTVGVRSPASEAYADGYYAPLK